MTSKVSRLDRQVILLETGSTQVVRNMAADQLGDLAKQHPEDILSLLSRVYPFLLVKKWETRVTAARAVGAIVSHAKVWDPNSDDDEYHPENINNDINNDIPIKNEFESTIENAKVKFEDDLKLRIEELKEEHNSNLLEENRNYYNLNEWNFAELLKTGKLLLSKSINEYDDSFKNGSENIRDDSIDTKKEPVKEEMTSGTQNKKSARMLAMAKRRKKIQAKGNGNTKQIDITQSSVSRNIANKKDIKPATSNASTLQNPKLEITEQADKSKLMIESVAAPILEQHERVAGIVWQFQGIYELLIDNIFNESWEIRHGAALGLRELMKKHAYGVNRLKSETREINDKQNKKSLEDLATRLLTIFALDRFGDFVNDTVVAPVRESVSQTLAALLIHLDDDLSFEIFQKLEQLVLQDPIVTGCPNRIWEATHGGLLGIRYFVSIKTDFLTSRDLLDSVVNVVLYGLRQSDDDVKSVAASILVPITDQFVTLQNEKIEILLTTMWTSLSELDDDLSSSVGSVMNLLAKLCQFKEVLDVLKTKAVMLPAEWAFKSLVPKLYPFLRHSITSVRKAVLNLLKAFLSIEDDSTKGWINSKIFRLVFQNILLEQNRDILDLSFEVYTSLLAQYKSKHTEKSLDHVFSKHLQPILHLLNTPIGLNGKNYSMEGQFILKPSQHYQIHSQKKRSISEASSNSEIPVPKSSEHVNIDAPMIAGDITLLGSDVIINTRVMAARAFGLTLAMFQDSTLQSFFSNVLVRCYELPYATPRMLAGVILTEFCGAWLKSNPDRDQLPTFVNDIFGEKINAQLSDPSSLPVFRELVPSLKALRMQCQTLLTTFVDVGMLPQHKLPRIAIVVQGETEAGPQAFTIETAEKVYNEYYPKLFKAMSNSYKILGKKPLEDARYRVQLAIDSTNDLMKARSNWVLCNAASSILLMNGIPPKLNPVIRSLMDSVKEETNEMLQQMAGNSVIHLLRELVKSNKVNVANKIVKNLCGFLCVDTSEVPDFTANLQYSSEILTLIKEDNSITDQEDIKLKKVADDAKLKRKGGLYTLGKLLSVFDKEELSKIPKFKAVLFEPLDKSYSDEELKLNESNSGQSIVDSMGILRVLFPYMNSELRDGDVIPRLEKLQGFLCSEFSVFRYSAARTFADIAKIYPVQVMPFIIRGILPMMNNAGSIVERQGASELIYHLSVSMGTEILPYVIFLIVPLLGRMSDSNHDVRSIATTTFASIIKLVPLEEGISDPEGLPEDLMAGREKERDFIQQMMDPSKAKPFKLPVAIKATLRKYQQDGVNWLAFLNHYNLHGILCDDMGLGKTLQTICIIASDQYLRQEDYKETHSVTTRPLPSLIVCPPSLTGHWENEFNQYSPFLKVLVYAGGPSQRYPLRDQLGSADIIVTSYDVARNDLEYLMKFDYNYCVLDEGHIIKNSQSKLAKAVKQLGANHRLILTGTPIQNNVVELWSLFDFLMPGFLGTEKMFQDRFAKPIAASRNSKTSSKEQEAGVLALEALHKQVLPFMLRRLKEDVLSDLPPKIIQDYYCELSDLQKQLYQDFAKKQKTVVQKDIQNTAEVDNKQHIFQALQYMRKLCNHPALVLSPDHPQLQQVQQYLKQAHLDLHDIINAPKLTALRTLLLECGIGEQEIDKRSNDQLLTTNVISQHRALIFCQLKDMLDMVENDLFKKCMPSVTYMRLDGTVDPRDRQNVVKKFNDDPSIDCLLLTTKVGGLGLNLTGADTVIFVEHDWNPMNDLQAMDRAHRLGQKKVVNVYRIITKGTLEEKIMGLQKFKMNIASTVVNQQNSGLASMDTHQLLDLFDTSNVPSQDEEQAKQNQADMEDVANETGLTGKAKEAVGELKELWDSSQYEEEYNLDNFIKTLR
ncbi:similar to Saccharomyces cerevisiae YPL082C MOT1 Essential abundant protein involved in regulation of transcription [Maudiozyma saulgeensis]|uniref:TATA-binding protein-associated factor mot1 n=1 Tax=Maudiozyma saulgeensis TaxID=1789683 RepID=A0A1X7R7J6_9SACH|nr:similar to Saccharomyces cerevisiae YPL082C MOT1 Essential abundant protein involved in regulation of transcription [Kazachstania saulgeensis]